MGFKTIVLAFVACIVLFVANVSAESEYISQPNYNEYSELESNPQNYINPGGSDMLLGWSMIAQMKAQKEKKAAEEAAKKAAEEAKKKAAEEAKKKAAKG